MGGKGVNNEENSGVSLNQWNAADLDPSIPLWEGWVDSTPNVERW